MCPINILNYFPKIKYFPQHTNILKVLEKYARTIHNSQVMETAKMPHH
jgi:hypothetical protein